MVRIIQQHRSYVNAMPLPRPCVQSGTIRRSCATEESRASPTGNAHGRPPPIAPAKGRPSRSSRIFRSIFSFHTICTKYAVCVVFRCMKSGTDPRSGGSAPNKPSPIYPTTRTLPLGADTFYPKRIPTPVLTLCLAVRKYSRQRASAHITTGRLQSRDISPRQQPNPDRQASISCIHANRYRPSHTATGWPTEPVVAAAPTAHCFVDTTGQSSQVLPLSPRVRNVWS